ncbi:ylmG homolog protein 1-2, chloroplastic-like [Dioscorea cayenensis subsp. rotundata]|uniref:YlmG homolog protein 1-2, chloroplastic-like n=1 Tax=Dioscorea cayennensis subsp. rotundata TaxID=55577 RepID=A0AB40AIQ0_DIOCR|nr:ylmG homolog protein 1-2, chloroplastic-like [Dioscorea cayenensis subsp. rotundata]XP_039114778.1 ylmG homolog protein 1-2, chloroplastic-like [Dioscorea cayenensis subsp. rotundata]
MASILTFSSISSPSPLLFITNPKPNFIPRFTANPQMHPLHLPALVRVSSRPPLKPFAVSASTAPSVSSPNPTLFSDSTRTVCSLLTLSTAAAFALRSLAHRLLSSALASPAIQQILDARAIQGTITTAGSLFFARLRDRPSGYLNTPLTVVAAGMSKWLDIYSGVLMVRVLLSWFPNIPWDRQPLSAIRDLCDPYLNLFRNIIPPVFDTLDVSPLLAFAVLGTLGSILNNSRGMY